MRAKRNFKAPKGMTPEEAAEAFKKYKAWHWVEGENPEFEQHMKMVEWDDPDFPEKALIECGRLVRLHFRAPNSEGRHPRRQRDTTITLNLSAAKQSYLTYDPNHPDERLYLCLAPDAMSGVASRFWHENTAPSRVLAEWATLAGGRHGKRAHASPKNGGYPQVVAKPVGILTGVVYFTPKVSDGPSFYLHRMGEVTCYMPILAADALGRLWVCGGDYTCPTAGITN